ncbi:sensor histidine kinase [Undibacterium fentianense]|uniref:histidine kinase n=1 Tax=Undibacterium fentianense TaxID=2828728 RepID=A0A941E4V7_9BURK|nr:sensor histidine kinase [Undibacterium fentianense]MBR7801217.1 sensor histidine kinase [Undibacterium fentianense]
MNQLKKAALCFFLFCMLPWANALAREQERPLPLAIQLDRTSFDLNGHWQIFEDKSATIGIEQILNEVNAHKFAKLKGNLSASYTDSVYWLKLSIQRPKNTSLADWWLEITPNMLDDVRAYQVSQGRIISTHQSGDHQKPSDAETKHRLAVFRFQFHDQEIHTIYLRLQTTSAMYLSAKLFTPQSFAEASNRESNLMGIYYGIMLAMIAYNLILTWSYRDKAIVLYLLFSCVTLLVSANNNGHLALYFPSTSPWLIETIQSLAVATLLFFYSLFVTHFLRLNKSMPLMADVFTFIQVFALAAIIGVLFGLNAKIASMVQIVAFIQMLLVLPIGISIGWRGFRPGYIVVAATTAWIAGGVLIIFRNLGIIESTWITEFGYQIGSAIEIILLALAQADRINYIKNENALTQEKLLSISKHAEQELELKIQTRTNELAEAVQRLEKLDQQKNEFLGIAAHDLKNPLTGIIGLSDLMRKLENNISPEQRYSYLERISRSGQRMMHIITNLLDVNALESGNTKLVKQKVNLNELSHQVLMQYEHTMRAKDIRHSFSYADSDPFSNPSTYFVLADPNASFQVLDNLISNAIKYSPIGKQIYIELHTDEHFATVSIQDQGPGLSEHDQQRLFEKFTKLSSTPTAGEHSSGLGLSIVKKLTEAMGGNVRCKSQLGEGCCFSVSLPLA